MLEIVIPEPRINQDDLRDYTFKVDGEVRQFIEQHMLASGRITPSTHPRVADVCAGDGSWARLLVDYGWNPSNITCIDRCVSPTPLVEGVTWRYWNVSHLATYLALSRLPADADVQLEPLPSEIIEHQGAYDIVAILTAPLHRDREQEVCRFLGRPRAFTVPSLDI